MNHTPVPYSAPGIPGNEGDIAIRGRGCVIAYVLPQPSGIDRANAAFIVKACNSHDAFVAALEAVERSCLGIAGLPTCGEREVLLGLAELARKALDTPKPQGYSGEECDKAQGKK